MKFTIDIKDFWMNGDDLEADIKKHITRQVCSDIWKQIESKAEVEIKNVSSQKLDTALSKRVENYMLTAKVNKDGKPVPLEELLDSLINRTLANSYEVRSMERRIEDKMKKTIDELIARYDMKFAAKIVDKLKEKKMLNETAIIQLLA